MFTAVLIVKNEEQVLDNCLQSVKHYPLITEIVIVDTGSKDTTKEIAKKYTKKIYDFKWCDDFAKARNFAKSKATNKWVISIDADETLESFFDEVPREQADGYFVILTNGIETTTSACRIFRKELNWQGKIHEYIKPKQGLESGITIKFGRSPSHDLDMFRNLRILAKVYKDDPKDQRNLYYLGRELYSLGQYNEALEALKEYSVLPIDFHNRELVDSYFLQSLCYYKLNKIAECKTMLGQVIIRNPFFKNAYVLLAKIEKVNILKEKWIELEKQADNKGVLLNINLDKLLG